MTIEQKIRLLIKEETKANDLEIKLRTIINNLENNILKLQSELDLPLRNTDNFEKVLFYILNTFLNNPNQFNNIANKIK